MIFIIMKSTTIMAMVLIVAAIGIGTSTITSAAYANLIDFHINPGKCHQFFHSIFNANGERIAKICNHLK
jgi:hypothetical protein